jgi:drug/metabolite transporter (DMT)-like permease
MKDLYRLTTKDILLLLFEGVFILFVANVIYYYVLKDNESSIVIALESSTPFFTLIFAYLLLNEKINFNGIIGIILIILGVICISYNNMKINIFETFSLRD